jgi:hypothetical protein
MTEKRRNPRLYRRFILRSAAFGEKPLRWSFVTIHNLSADGALFTYDRRVYLGMLLHLKIDFPDHVIECLGRVVRIGGAREGVFRDVAVRLEGIPSDAQAYIDGFIRQNLP